MKYRIVTSESEPSGQIESSELIGPMEVVNVQAERRQLAAQLEQAIKLGVTPEPTTEHETEHEIDYVPHYSENCVDSECPKHGTAQEIFSAEIESECKVEDDSVPELVFSGGEVPCAMLTGRAGSGKTTFVRQHLEADPKWGLLCATTGIAAINLNTITINSLLGFFNTDSMEDAWVNGRLNRKLREVAKSAKVLVLDEVSMMPAKQLDILYRAIAEFNESADTPHGADFDDDDAPVVESVRDTRLKLLLVGDFCQLPPVKDAWAFEAECWSNFASNTTKLTKIWRQTEPDFVAAMNALREGNGKLALDLLVEQCGVMFHDETDAEFEGTTVVAKNDQVDRINQLAQMRVKGALVQNQTKRVGLQRGEWTKNIPNWQQFKVGSYVMLLANQYEYPGGPMVYANGDCGYIREYDTSERVAQVELVRNGRLVEVPVLTRDNSQRTQPKEDELRKLMANKNWVPGERVPGVKFQPFKNEHGKWVVGSVEYLPMRLAYASTVHKCQGLSLDKLQLDLRPAFMGSYNMEYVGFSRCRTVGGLRLVGSGDLLVKRCQVDPKVRQFL